VRERPRLFAAFDLLPRVLCIILLDHLTFDLIEIGCLRRGSQPLGRKHEVLRRDQAALAQDCGPFKGIA